MDDATRDELNNPFLSPVPPPDASHASGQPSSWPQVIGIIATVFGTFAALGGCWNIVSTLFFVEMLGDLMGESPQGAIVLDQLEKNKLLIIVLGVVVMLLAVWLLLAGIGLLRRARWAVPVALSWSIAKMVLVLANAFIGFRMQQAQMQAFAAGPDGPPVQAFSPAMTGFFMLIGVAWGWALPVFFLIWFSRSAVRQEIATW